ncbi:MAG: hypothetical protein GAK45_00400 [Pseudomonas citronellolis]|nr:MAG: hypothetical protein GAK45_00400 [Pseudomonas citronellolis]
MSAPRHSAGFTLIELMTVLMILAVFVSIALPAFTGTINNNRLQSSTNELYRLLQFARTEAVARQGKIVVTAPAANNWAGDVTVKAGTQVLRQVGSTGIGTGVSASAGSASITFNAAGSTGSKACVTLCSTQNTSLCRYIAVQVTGRILTPGTSKPGECT